MKLEQITFTRFIAAIAIVIFHFGRELAPFNSKYVNFILAHANTGVSYFFILSGFIMIVAYWKSDSIDYKNYLRNRFARIYPVYVLALVGMLIYNLLVALPNDWVGLALNITCTQAWFPERALSFNGPGWSLAVELFFYAVFPYLFNRFYSRRSAASSYALPIILLFVTTQLGFNWFIKSAHYGGPASASHGFIYYNPLMHLNEFLIGNLAGLYFVKLDKSKSRNYDFILIGLLGLFIILLKYGTAWVDFHDGLLAFIFAPLIIFTSLNTGFITKIFRNKLLIFLGEISFGIYILQIPIFYYTKTLLSHFYITDKAMIFYSSLVALLVVSVISFIFIEAPLRNKLKASAS